MTHASDPFDHVHTPLKQDVRVLLLPKLESQLSGQERAVPLAVAAVAAESPRVLVCRRLPWVMVGRRVKIGHVLGFPQF